MKTREEYLMGIINLNERKIARFQEQIKDIQFQIKQLEKEITVAKANLEEEGKNEIR